MQKKSPGFTLLEVVIVIVVIAILAAAVLTGARSLLHRQRFNDAAERIRTMVELARNRSQTEVAGTKSIGVAIDVGEVGAVTLFEDGAPRNAQFNTPPDTIIETLSIDAKDFRIKVSKDTDVPCAISATVVFTTKTAGARLACDGVSAGVSTIKITLESTQYDSISKSFLMHRESGILQ